MEMQAQLSGISDGMLAAMASSPMNPFEQMAVLAELGKRMKERQGGPPTTNVLQDIQTQDGLANKSMPLQNSSGAPNDNIVTGTQNIVAQQAQAAQQAQQPVRQMRMGGRVDAYEDRIELPNGQLVPRETSPPRRRSGGGYDYLGDIERNAPRLKELYASTTNLYPSTTEEAIRQAQAFEGPDRLSPFAEELRVQDAESLRNRKSNKWLALANAGFSMIGAPTLYGGISRGGLTLGRGLAEAEEGYRRDRDRNFTGRLSIAQAQDAGSRATMSRASENFNRGIAARSGAESSAISTAANLAQQRGADARAARGDDALMRQYEQLIEMGHSPEDARDIISAAVGGRTGTGAELRDDIIRNYQLLRERGNPIWLEMSQEERDAETARYMAALGGAAPITTAKPTQPPPTTQTTQRPTGIATPQPTASTRSSRDREPIGLREYFAPFTGRGRAAADRPLTAAEKARTPRPVPSAVDGYRIDYGDRPPGSNPEEYRGWTKE